MLRRLRVYFTGFGLGLIAVYVIFSNGEDRNLDIWIPEQRILEDIRGDEVFQKSEKLACFKSCVGLSDELMATLWLDSKTKSLNPGGDPYRYLITLKTDEHHIEAQIEWDKKSPRKLILLRDLQHPTDCPCNE